MPPLIKIKLVLNNNREVFGIYDSGANVSLINSSLLNINNKKQDTPNRTNIKTINGVKKTNGRIKLNVKIFNIEKEMNAFVIDKENFDFDFLVGLDYIKEFQLIQDENLRISQKAQQKHNTFNKKKSNRIKNDLITQKIENTKHLVNYNEHVKEENFNISINHLDYDKQSKIDDLIRKNAFVFARDKYDIGTVTDYEAHIDLLMEKYCSKRPYRCTFEDKKEIESQITKLLETKLIEESYSPFAAPVTLAFKRDENRKSRLCIDFRNLNKIVVPQSQPFPLIEDLMVNTRDCKFFSKLDINSAFWSIPLRISDKYKTAFVTQEGHFQWTCLPFGLKTAPAIFQRILCNIIRKHKLTTFTVNYIDDILIFSKSFTDHIDHLTQLFQAIKKEGFKLKFSKCSFAQDSVKYLGHIIQNNSVKPLKDNLISIKNFPIPKTSKNVRQFLGKINFYHKYVPKIAIKLDPLHRLLKKGQEFNWTKECQESFDEMKEILCTQPVLTIFDPHRPIYIYTDASLRGIGAVLKQPQEDGEEKPVAYFSKKLNEVQKKKKAIYLECLAIKECVRYWQHLLMGKKFIIFSDHKPLENLNIKSRTDEELGDLTYYLSQYDLEIKYKQGKYNIEADCLSRNPVLDPNDNLEEQLKIVNIITLENILKDQKQNIEIQMKKDKFISRDNIIYKKQKYKEKIILSEKFSIQLLKDIHENLCHIGIQQMQKSVCPYYTAKNLIKNIKNICKNCTVCKKNKTRGQPKHGLMSQLGPASKPFEIMSIDTVGGLGGTRSTKKYLHLLVDHFTRYAYILTSKTQNAADFIKLVDGIAKTEKIDMILSDQYPGINSQEFKKYLKDKNTLIVFTAVNSPFSNGLNERLNQTLINKIRCKINEKQKKVAWATIAHECVRSYNETTHSITGFTPSYLMNGADVSLLPKELKKNPTKENWFRDKEIALKNSTESHEYNKKIYDKNRKNLNFNVGDKVFIENGNKLNRRKLDELRIGPYVIIERISNSIFKINTGHKKEESNLFHISKLTPIPMLEEKNETTNEEKN